MTTEWLSYKDLRAAGIVSNWQTLRTWQRIQAFPAGRLFGPNTRRWSRAEIEEWLASRPTAGAAKQRDHADTRKVKPAAVDAAAGFVSIAVAAKD